MEKASVEQTWNGILETIDPVRKGKLKREV
jgi:hypothetical protein